MAAFYIYGLIGLGLFSLLSAGFFAFKLPKQRLSIGTSLVSREYRRLCGALALSATFFGLAALTAGDLNAAGSLVDNRSAALAQTRLNLLGYLVALAILAGGILGGKAVWNLALRGMRLVASPQWAEQRVRGITLSLIGTIAGAAIMVIVVAFGVSLLFSSDPGGVFRGAIQDEGDLFARFAAQPVQLFASADPGSQAIAILDKNTALALLARSPTTAASGLVSVIVTDGAFAQQKGWVDAAQLSRTRNVGLVGYLGDFVAGLVHPLTLKAIGFGCLLTGAMIGLVSLFLCRLYFRYAELTSILLGILILAYRFTLFDAAGTPGAAFLIPEALVVLLFDFLLSKIIPRWRIPGGVTPPPAASA